MIATNYIDFSFSSSFRHRGVISLKLRVLTHLLRSNGDFLGVIYYHNCVYVIFDDRLPQVCIGIAHFARERRFDGDVFVGNQANITHDLKLGSTD